MPTGNTSHESSIGSVYPSDGEGTTKPWEELVTSRDAARKHLRLVDAFHPTKKQRQVAIDIQEHKPISLKEAENLKD
jgi:hypothetical protein